MRALCLATLTALLTLPAATARADGLLYQLPEDGAWVRFDMLGLRGAQGRFEDAGALAKGLLDNHSFCPPTRMTLKSWIESGKLPENARKRFEKLLDGAQCD